MTSGKKDIVPKHRHCNSCGTPIPPDETFCSKECADKLIGQRKKQQRSTMIFMGIIFLALLVYLFFGSLSKAPPPTP